MCHLPDITNTEEISCTALDIIIIVIRLIVAVFKIL